MSAAQLERNHPGGNSWVVNVIDVELPLTIRDQHLDRRRCGQEVASFVCRFTVPGHSERVFEAADPPLLVDCGCDAQLQINSKGERKVTRMRRLRHVPGLCL